MDDLIFPPLYAILKEYGFSCIRDKFGRWESTDTEAVVKAFLLGIKEGRKRADSVRRSTT